MGKYPLNIYCCLLIGPNLRGFPSYSEQIDWDWELFFIQNFWPTQFAPSKSSGVWECARLLLICTYLQNPRLRPRPRLRTPRNIIHPYPKTTNPDPKCPASKEHHQLKTTPKDEILKNPSHFQTAQRIRRPLQRPENVNRQSLVRSSFFNLFCF